MGILTTSDLQLAIAAHLTRGERLTFKSLRRVDAFMRTLNRRQNLVLEMYAAERCSPATISRSLGHKRRDRGKRVKAALAELDRRFAAFAES